MKAFKLINLKKIFGKGRHLKINAQEAKDLFREDEDI